MKKIQCGFLMLFLMVFWNSQLNAQMSNYSFGQQTGQTYSAITGGTVLSPDNADDYFVSAIPIGFSFKFNGTDYTMFGACTNGFIGFGAAALSPLYYYILENVTSGNVISAFGYDLYMLPSSELMYKTEGIAPNRVLTVQYKNFTMFGDNNPILNFQIKLLETTNQIKLCYGAMSNINATYLPEVGMTGTSNADLVCRTTTSNWTATTSSTSSATCTFSAGVYPPNGLVFVYSSIPVPVATSATAITTAGFTTNWGSVSDVTSYILEVSADNFATQITGSPFTIAAPAVTKGITGLGAGTLYKYRVKVVNSKGTGEPSNVVSVSTLPVSPIASAATSVNTGGFTANWSVVTGATSYSLYVSADNFVTQIAGSPFAISAPTVTKVITGLAAGTAYKYKVKAVNSGGSGDDSNVVDVTTPTPPSVTSFSPGTAAAGTTVTITGTDLVGATAVSFGGTSATSFTVVSSTSVTAVVASGTSGSVSVTTPGGTAARTGFTFVPAPTVSSFSPASATTQQTVVITGSGFTGATAVTFGGSAPSSFTVVSSTSISAVVANGTSGSVSVTTLGGSASKTGFTFNPCLQITAPADITVNVASGANGAVVNYSTPVGTNPCGYYQSFGYTGSGQTYYVPEGIYSINYDLGGGAGGSGIWPYSDPNTGQYLGVYYDILGGYGGNITGTLAVTPGTTINVFVGDRGQSPHYSNSGSSYNGGGNMGAISGGNLYAFGGHGGGATDLRIGGTALTNRVAVAGGGGGGGGGASPNSYYTAGGPGGGLTGGSGYGQSPNGGGAGSQIAGGIAGGGGVCPSTTAGTLGIGGDGGSSPGNGNGPGNPGGGGGGGYYGGGGGYWGGGGGGSNYPTAGTQGTNSSSGYATIGYTLGGVPNTTRTAGLASGATFPLGTTTVTYIVTDGLGNSKSATFRVTVNRIPAITDFTPVISSQGQTVTITGTDFTGATAVSFGGTPATSFTVVSSTTITAVVGAGASGSINVTTAGGTASKSGFTWTILPTPTISSVSVPADGTYLPGGNLDFTVNYSENVFVNTGGGIPAIPVTLNTGGTVPAGYISGSGTQHLLFRYTVATGDLDMDGIVTGSSIVKNGGTMKSNLGQDASLVLAGVNSTANVKVDGVAPTAIFSFGSNAMKIGESMVVTITFSEAVTGFSNANLTVPNGTLDGVSSADGGTTWTGTFTPLSNLENAVNQIVLDYSGIADLLGNSSTGTINSPNFSIDTKRPTVTLVPAATAGGDAFVNAAEKAAGFNVVAQSSESNGRLYVVPSTTANNLAAITSASIGSAVSAGANVNTTIAISANNSGITDGTSYKVYAIDGAGNISLLSDPAFSTDLSVPDAPVVTGPSNGFSSNDNKPSLSGTAEANSRVTVFVDGVANGTTTADATGNWSYAPAVGLSDGSHAFRAICADAAGNSSVSSGTTNIVVDTTPPTVSSVAVPANGTFTLGQNLDFTVNFTETVLVSGGIPYLTLTIGGNTVHANYLSGSGSANLVFRYTTTSGDLDTDGIAIGPTISPNGSTIRDVAGNGSILTLNGMGNTSNVKVDAIVLPTTQSSELHFSDVQRNSFNIGWTNGDGAGRVVFVKASDTGTTNPFNNTYYLADAVFTGGSQIGSGWYCIYNGTGSSVTLTGLAMGTSYIAQVFEYNGPAGSEKYLTATAVNNPKSQMTLFCINPSSGGTIGTDQIGCTPFDPLELTNLLLPSGNTGTLEYKWQVSSTSSSSGFVDIAGSNSASFDPGPIAVTSWYRRLARVSCMGDWTGAIASNVVKISLSPVSVGGDVTGGFNAITYGSTTGIMTLVGETGTILKWQKRVGAGNWTDMATAAGTYSETPVSAGTWQYRAQVKSGPCSEAFSNPMSIVVSPKSLTIKAEDKSKIYDGAYYTPFTVTYNGFVPGENQAVLSGVLSFTGTAANTADAGTNYVITPGGLTSGNYNISFVSGILNIDRKELTITATGPSKDYGTLLEAGKSSTNFISTATEVWSEVVTQVVLTPDATGSSPTTAAGKTYVVAPSLATGTGGFKESNYKINYVPFRGVTSKRALMISADNKSKNYGAPMPILTIGYAGLVNGDSMPVTAPSITTTAVASSPAGSYTISVVGADDPNYAISYTSGVLKIDKVPLAVVADFKSKNYGAELPILTFQYIGLVNGNEAPTTAAQVKTLATSSSPAGSYPIVVSGAADPNYSITCTNAVLTVNKVPLMIDVDNLSKNYGAALPVLHVTYSGLVNGDTAPATPPSLFTLANLSSPVATYPITAYGAADPNYTISYTMGALTVNKVPLLVVAENKSKAYGAALPMLTVSYSGLVNGNRAPAILPVLGTTATASSPVANYPITASGASDPNYSISYASGTLNVEKMPLMVVVDGQTKSYGAALPPLTVFYIGLVNGNKAPITLPSVSTTALATSPVGSYPITASGAADPNYTITYSPAVLTVSKVSLIIAAENKSKSYGAEIPTLTFSYSGLVNGNVSPSTVPVVSTTATASSPVSNYPITVSGAADPNYIISYVPGIMIVNKVALVVSADDKSKMYGAPNPELTFTCKGLVNGDKAPAKLPVVATSAIVSSPVSTYPIMATGASDPNYTINYSIGILTVKKVALKVTADAQSKVYGETDPRFTYSSAPALSGNDSFTGDLGRDYGENVGSYAIGIGTLSAGLNYDLTFEGKMLNITSKTLTVTNTILNTSKTYNGSTSANVVPGTLQGVTQADQYSIGISAVANYADKNIGTNKSIHVAYSLTGLHVDNYIKPSDYSVTNGEIVARQLTVSNTVVATDKMVDGNTLAAVQAVGTLSGVDAGDANIVNVKAIANYSDATAGASKTITVVYTLGGSGSGNYIGPVNLLITGARISEKVVIQATLSSTPGCQGSNLELNYTVVNGSPVQYQIVFGDKALQAGFQPTTFLNLPATGNSGTVPITVPPDIKYGSYQATIQFRNALGVVSDLYTFTFVVNVPADYIVPKFDDVILCNNETNNFVAFQWYKNGLPIADATKQYYSDPEGLVGAYSVKLQMANGQEIYTCPKSLNIPLKKKVTVSVFPNPVKVNQASTVKIAGLSEQELQGAVMHIYNIQGVRVFTTAKVELENSVNLQNLDGVYMGHILTATGSDYTYRLLLIK